MDRAGWSRQRRSALPQANQEGFARVHEIHHVTATKITDKGAVPKIYLQFKSFQGYTLISDHFLEVKLKRNKTEKKNVPVKKPETLKMFFKALSNRQGCFGPEWEGTDQ